MERKQVILNLLKKGYLVSPEIIAEINDQDDLINNLIKKFDSKNIPLVINREILQTANKKPETPDLSFKIKPNVKILKNYTNEDKKIEVGDFVNYFKLRYKEIRGILQRRPELQDVISINRILNKKEKEKASFIGILSDKHETKNGNFILTFEDLTGKIKVIVSKNERELHELCKDIMLDEVLGVNGSLGKEIIFARSIIYPDLPLTKELKKSPDEVYAICTSDLHVGSTYFYKENFLKFIDWLNGNFGGEKQAEITKKVKYLFLCGDLTAGVGVYPKQEDELAIKDVYEQYKELAGLLGKIRKDIFIIACPGNHDSVRMSEPQPILSRNFAKPLFELQNIIFANNPGWINIHSSENFDGFTFLLYHGFSFFYYASNVESIRKSGGSARGDLIKKYLLQRRHLAPSHTSTLYFPDSRFDPLIIDIIPDFFVSGHLHQISNEDYRNVTMIGCGCWEKLTKYQEKTGSKSDPCKITLINLKNREIKVLNFLKDS